MLAAKQAALNAINKLPEDADIEEIMYQLYVVDKIQKAQRAIEKQKIFSSDELKLKIDSW
jgi:5,10-methylene-tetrahydrofolate dehydrogenase/methenyl tetrahydrofolate cyclohydrolase